MKQSNYSLSIPQPCSQDWLAMESSMQGKYCRSCSKNVIDFTQLNDQEILQIISKSSGTLCGRLDQPQLNRLLLQNKKRSSHSPIYKLLAGFLLLALPGNAAAKEYSSHLQTLSTPDRSSLENSVTVLPDKTPSDSLKTIHGLITDLSNDTLIGVIVTLKGSNIGTTSNFEGKYTLHIPDAFLELEDSLVFEVDYFGYERLEFKLSKNDLPARKDVVLNSNGLYTVVGEISVTQHPKKKWWQRKKKSD